MPFKENDDQTKEWGRKGGEARAFVFADGQLQKMQELLDKDLEIAKRIQEQEEISPKDEKRLSLLQSRILKYADKLHATKTTNEHTGNLIINIEKEVADKYADTKPESNNTGQTPI